MPVALSQIRDLLLPGLWEVSGDYAALPRTWASVFDEPRVEFPPIPLSPAATLAVAAAAVVLRNPVVTRRFWKWWS